MRLQMVVMSSLVCAGWAAAQVSPLYIQDQGSGKMYKVQGGSVVATWNTSSNEASIAVTQNEIRTVGYFAGGTGREYDLNGNPTGPTYNGAWNYTFEGTTDAVDYNYTFQYAGGGMLTRYDRTWQNPTSMFSFGNEQFFGVTYDSSDGSFFGAGITSGIMRHYSGAGQFINQWNLPTSDHTLVAYEPASDTVWTMSRSDGNNLRQWAKDGTALQVIQVSGWSQSNILAMEFALGPIPAPGAAALLGAGGLMAARRRRA